MYVTALCLMLTAGVAGDVDSSLIEARFDEARSVRSWSFHNGPEFPGATGRLAWDGEQGHDRPGALAMHYSFAGGGNYVQATWNLPRDNAARTLSLWLKKPHRNRITFRAVDASGQTFQKPVDYHYPGWQQLEVNLAAWGHSWGGAGDGKVRFPLRQIGILIENSAEPREGVLLIDDIELTGRATGHRSTLEATYVAGDFAGGANWPAAGGPGNQLEDGQWRYAFNAGARPTLYANFSLLARPMAMRLVLEGDGSGHAIHAQIGSHFQNFHRRLGTLGKGEQTIEVPLGDMSTWQHHGGQNDGQARYPLRLQRIWLEPGKAGPASGTIRLKRLEVDIAFAASESVLITPDVRARSTSEGSPSATYHFSVQLQNLRAQPAKGQLICEFRSLGRRLDVQAVEMELPPGAKRVQRAFAYPLGDHHMIEASFQWLDPEHTSRPVAIGVSASMADPGSATLDPDSVMGCGLYLYRWRGNPRAAENMTRIAQLAQAAGIKWTREEIQWGATEPEPGRYDFAFYDQMIDIANAHGISVYGLLCYWSGWAKASTDEGIDQYCNWVRQVVRRYKGKIKYWEIWNEPNIFFWSGPKELYATLLTRAYETVKAEDPDAIVLGCSTSGIDTDFIKMVMERGGKFDALTIHPYRGLLDDLGYIEELRNVHELVGGRDVWITEIGFPSQLVTGWSERRQASLAARTYLASVASGVIRNVAWYDFRNDGADPFEMEQNFGLVRSDMRLKPAYRAVATVCRTLDGMEVKERIEAGPGTYAYRFSDGQRDVVAVCAPASGRLLTFETNGTVSIVDGVGQPVEPARDGRRLTVTLDTGFPVYVSSQTGFTFRPAEPPVRLSATPESIRPGDTVTITLTPELPVREWDLPYGWPAPRERSAGVYELQVPPDAAPGGRDLQAIVGEDGLRVPFTIRVAEAVIRM